MNFQITFFFYYPYCSFFVIGVVDEVRFDVFLGTVQLQFLP